MMIDVAHARQQLAQLPGDEFRIKREQLDCLYALAERGQRAMLALGNIASSAVAASSAGTIA